jgi:transposase
MIIGIDISKKTFDIAFFKDAHWHSQVFEQQREHYQALLCRVGIEGNWFVMEATGSYFLKLADFITEQGGNVAVLNPKTIHHFGKMRLKRAKTDKKDARLIAQYSMDYEAELKKWQSADQDIIHLRQLQSLIALLIQQRTMLINHQEALNQQPEQSESVTKELAEEKMALDERIKRLEQEVEERVQCKWSDEYQRLTSIAGIGKVTATALLVMTYGFSRFTEVKAFLSYIGLAPAPHQSGTSIKGKGHISKIGSPVIRRLLYLCSWTAKKQNPPCKLLYERLKSKGKPEKVIKIAIAHKLLRQAFAVVLKGQNFDPKMA